MDVIDAVREAVNSVRSNGRVPRQAAARLRAAIRQHQDNGQEPPVQDIVGGLPPFESLPADVQENLYATVLNDDWWSMRLRRAGWRQAFARTTRTAAVKLERHPRVRRLLDYTESLFLIWHARLLHELYRASLMVRGRVDAQPTLAAALKLAGLDARVIASSYLRRTPQPIETAAYWHDPVRQRTVGVVIGIDFIVNDEGVWFVESNLNVGLIEERSELYQVDPFVTNLVQFARDKGYTSIVYLACNDYGVDTIMARRMEETAAAAGLRATVVEDRYAPQGRLSQSYLVPPFAGDRTLVVRGKMFHTTLDALFHNKTLTLQAIEAYQQSFADTDVQLPPRVETLPERLPMKEAFPNLVYKFPERDQGQGVIFLRAPSVARAREILADRVEMNRHSVANIWTKLRYSLKLEDQAGIFQSYISSSLLEGRRLAVARAHVLATPVGNVFLSAHRIVSNLAVPESLPEGLVTNATPYIVNYSLDSVHAPMPPDEEARVSRAALGVVRALCWAVEARYETGPGDRKPEEHPAGR